MAEKLKNKLFYLYAAVFFAGLALLPSSGETLFLPVTLFGLFFILTGYPFPPLQTGFSCVLLSAAALIFLALTGHGPQRYYGLILAAASFSLIKLEMLRKENLSKFTERKDEKQKRINEVSRQQESLRAAYGNLDEEIGRMSKLYDLSQDMEKSTDTKSLAGRALESLGLKTGADSLVFFERHGGDYGVIGMLGPRDAGQWLEELESGEKRNSFLKIAAGKNEPGLVGIDRKLTGKERREAELLVNQIALGYEKARLYEEVRELSRIDGLTGLCLRRYFFERFEEELKIAKREKYMVGFIILDIDNFKNYNDTYGHPAGDKLLRNIAGIVRQNIYITDFAGRYGGEEFCIYMPRTDREGTLRKAEKIRVSIEQKTSVTLSAGVAFFPESAKGSDAIVGIADKELYRAKNTGKNRIFVHPESG